MKQFTLILTILCFSLNTSAQRKKEILKEIKAYKQDLVENAKYDFTYSEVWNMVYQLTSDEYPNITRESESRGYIEANKEQELSRQILIIEILGDSAPYEVSFELIYESRSNTDESYTRNTTDAIQTFFQEKELLKVKTKFYTMMIGQIEITSELQQKIDNYNVKQTKDRKKLVEGKDY